MSENTKIPTPEELQRDVAEFLKEKYGKNVIIPPEPNAIGAEPGAPHEGKKETFKINFDLKTTELERYLKKFIVGQDEAIIKLTKAIRRTSAGLKNPNRPFGSFIFSSTSAVSRSIT